MGDNLIAPEVVDVHNGRVLALTARVLNSRGCVFRRKLSYAIVLQLVQGRARRSK